LRAAIAPDEPKPDVWELRRSLARKLDAMVGAPEGETVEVLDALERQEKAGEGGDWER
jgi:hypothetical protein